MWTKAFAVVLLAAVAVVVAVGRDTPVRRAVVRADAGRRVLERPLPEVRFENVRFVEAVEKLKQLSGVVLAVDRPALESGGVEGAPVTVHRRNAPLGHVLESIVGQASTEACAVVFVADGDAVLITTAEALNQRPPVVRVYDVRDVIVPPFTEPPTFGQGAGGQGGLFPSPPPFAPDELESLVRQTVAPDSWRYAGGSVGQVQHVAGRLVVAQTAENHAQVGRLLAQLREPPHPPEPPRPAPDVLIWHEGIAEWTLLSSGPAEAALARRVPTFRLDEVPLEEAIDALRKQWGVKLHVKWKDLDREGFDRRAGVTADLRDVTLAEALDAVVAGHRGAGEGRRLSYAIESGLVTVLTEALELPNFVTRVYDIRDWPPLRETPPEDDDGMTRAERQRRFRHEVVADLVRNIEASIDPHRWGGQQGHIDELHGSLIVTQTLANHERIRRLLNALRVASTTRPSAGPATAASGRPSTRGAQP